ncbi:archaetidylserine decarboxylase [Staphylospora marina]|uniref:archaetidylserine decarboxylase n=1 Tax=Staphylospora marina TaxID=2490858 RepID=UPI000F5BC5A0|nr:archaetidylserine decarboxylase [Staphylospora marina]
MKHLLSRTFWKRLPKKTISRWMGKFARHPVSRHVIPLYVKMFDVDLAPVKRPLDQFSCLLDFFVRELDPEARPVHPGKEMVISPVDGTVSQIGTIENGTLLQAKGISYSARELLGGDRELADRFSGGAFVTIYLSPRDYHRIHMPVEGTIEECIYIPGELYPVNKTGIRLIPGLFAVNERLVSLIRSSAGMVALVKVGATNVGSIRVSYDEEIVTNPRPEKPYCRKVYHGNVALDKGGELGRFEFGSTVILLFEPGRTEWLIPKAEGTVLRMGEPIARIIRPTPVN